MRPKEKREIIRKALEALRDRKGVIRPESVVRAARDKRNVLHDLFLWDDARSAQLQREQRAAELIHTYCTVFVQCGVHRVVSPVYARDPRLPHDEKGLVAVTHASLNSENALAIVLNEFGQCAGHIHRAVAIAALLDRRFPGLSERLDKLLRDLINIREGLKAAA